MPYPEERAKVQGLNDFLVLEQLRHRPSRQAHCWNLWLERRELRVLPLLGLAASVIAFALWRLKSGEQVS